MNRAVREDNTLLLLYATVADDDAINISSDQFEIDSHSSCVFPSPFADHYDTEYYSEYDCNLPLLEHAVLSATSSLRERGPENARLNGELDNKLAFNNFHRKE